MEMLFVLTLLAVLQGLHGLTQTDLDYIGTNLGVLVKLTDNLKNDGKSHLMFVNLVNNGPKVIKTNGLNLYFYSFFMVEPDFLPHPLGHVSGINKVRLYHVNGMLFRAEFLPNFGVIQPGQSRQLSILAKDWAVSKTDVLNNWYVTATGLQPRTLVSTSPEDLRFVEPFLNANQWKRYADDVYNPPTPQDRFSRIKARDLGRASVINKILPTPKEVTLGTSDMVVDSSWVISSPPELAQEADYLASELGLSTSTTPRAFNVIVLETDVTSSRSGDWYNLRTIPLAGIVSVRGESNSGVFYGIQSLLALHAQTKAGLTTGQVSLLPEISITDTPRYQYRGLLLDVARNFHSKESVMRLIDLMSMYKLNKLHLHLSDDEGWRLYIPGIPELTEVGGKRCHDQLERKCIHPQLGSGPIASLPGSGYYLPSDFEEILRHAAKRHVEVIPAFAMPSHAHAAIKAMNKRSSANGANDYVLSDPTDTSKYISVQMFNDDVMNPCVPSTYNFIHTIVTSVKKIYQAANTPLKIFNFEGEAVPEGAWVNSTACNSAFPGLSPEHLQTIVKAYFLTRVADIIVSKEKLNMAAFEDAFVLDNVVIPGGSSKVLAVSYQNVWEWGSANRSYVLANNGYSVALSPVTHLSFDHPYEAEPKERGLYWGTRFTDTYKAFSLRPENLYLNIDVMRSGQPINRTQVCGPKDEKCDPLRKPENVKGIQAMLWSELIRSREHLDYMAFPRVLALAERAWHQAPWEKKPEPPLKEWELFANIVGYNELPRLQEAGVEYRIPPPGASIADFLVTIKSEFPGLRHQYSTNGGATWTEYTNQFYVFDGRPILLRTVTADGKRASRTIHLPTAAP